MTLSFEQRQEIRRLVSEAKRVEVAMQPGPESSPNCLHCDTPLRPPKKKFCCDAHRNRYWELHSPLGQAYYRRKVNNFGRKRDRRKAAA